MFKTSATYLPLGDLENNPVMGRRLQGGNKPRPIHKLSGRSQVANPSPLMGEVR
jgi:hypothetical protein